MRLRFFAIVSVGEIREAGGGDGGQLFDRGAGERDALVGGPEEDVDFEERVRGGRRRQEVDYGVGVGGGDGAEEGAGVEEAWGVI